MSIGIKVYQTRDFIRKDARGAIDLERSLEDVRHGTATHYFKGHNIAGSARHRGRRRPCRHLAGGRGFRPRKRDSLRPVLISIRRCLC